MSEVKRETEFFLTLSSAESESALTAREQRISLNNKNLYMYFVCFLLPNVYINNVSKIRWAYQLKEKKEYGKYQKTKQVCIRRTYMLTSHALEFKKKRKNFFIQ